MVTRLEKELAHGICVVSAGNNEFAHYDRVADNVVLAVNAAVAIKFIIDSGAKDIDYDTKLANYDGNTILIGPPINTIMFFDTKKFESMAEKHSVELPTFYKNMTRDYADKKSGKKTMAALADINAPGVAIVKFTKTPLNNFKYGLIRSSKFGNLASTFTHLVAMGYELSLIKWFHTLQYHWINETTRSNTREGKSIVRSKVTAFSITSKESLLGIVKRAIKKWKSWPASMTSALPTIKNQIIFNGGTAKRGLADDDDAATLPSAKRQRLSSSGNEDGESSSESSNEDITDEEVVDGGSIDALVGSDNSIGNDNMPADSRAVSVAMFGPAKDTAPTISVSLYTIKFISTTLQDCANVMLKLKSAIDSIASHQSERKE